MTCVFLMFLQHELKRSQVLPLYFQVALIMCICVFYNLNIQFLGIEIKSGSQKRTYFYISLKIILFFSVL
jgi:hypothetical protein